jgi:4-hydroxythreonine-4-phosphate dehydrogenase
MVLTLGEPAGVGPDCVLRAFTARPQEFRDVIVIGSPAWLKSRAGEIGLDIGIRPLPELSSTPDSASLNCWPAGISHEHPVTCGTPLVETADDVIHCIRTAARACLDGHARAMITGPIDKSVLQRSGFAFPGHTEFLAHLAKAKHVVMMLAADKLRVALLTTHMSIREVPCHLSRESTLDCLRIVSRELKHRFGIKRPHLALCSLNPHAGEKGYFGREELDILEPAVRLARREGIPVEGPLPADTLFSRDHRNCFDAIVCCYHDQGLIPIKALNFGAAVNITLGLPFVRTSPDHGTGLDRAGSASVSYSSLMKAIQMARSLSKEEPCAVM